MSTHIADLHRSRLESLLAIEIEFQRKTVALSNQRINEIKRLLSSVDELYTDVSVDERLTPSSESASSVSTTKSKKKKKHKKAQPPTKPVRLVTGKPPRLIDAIQIVIDRKSVV